MADFSVFEPTCVASLEKSMSEISVNGFSKNLANFVNQFISMIFCTAGQYSAHLILLG